MKIQDIMNRPVESCGPRADLSAAAMIMWRQDCGVVPVVDEQRRVLGVVTDRDVCIAVATRHRRPEELTVSDVMAHRLFTVRPDEDVHVALETMRRERIRRLPVVDADKRLVGIVSVNDLVLAAKAIPGPVRGELTANEVLETLQAICAHAVPMRVAERPREREKAHVG
jgi:CBS-domain-containing membrane protein